jgi:hypothetical protein
MPVVTVGVSISFGILDILNIAHPAFIILGSYIAYTVDAQFGVAPIVASIVALPVFYGLGAAINQVYYLSFEKHGQDSLRGLALFFGILFIRRWLALVFGVDYRYVQAGYIEQSQVPLGVMRTFAALVCAAEQLHMHQPLHVSDHGDAGGNKVLVTGILCRRPFPAAYDSGGGDQRSDCTSTMILRRKLGMRREAPSVHIFRT